MKSKFRVLITLLPVLLALVLTGCGKEPPVVEETVPVVETTEETVPPTTPEAGNPDDATCKGTYTGSESALKDAADTVVATMEDAELTNRKLQLYYWLEVADYCRSDAEIKPDLSQSLDTQICPIDDSVNSWQQYFLQRALNAWHTHHALNLHAAQVPMPLEEAYVPNPQHHVTYLTDKPATKYLYGYNPYFQPNEMHQAYLDEIPAQLQSFATAAGFANTDALAAALSGGLAKGADLEAYALEMNTAYTYFTELTYAIEPTAEDVAAYAAEQGIPESEDTRVDLRHVLLIPEGAEVAADGTVSCSEEAWEACLAQAQALLDGWRSGDATDPRFAELANRNSADAGSRLNGGLYVDLRKGELMEELDSWCFDDARQPGDTEIIRTACGYHILYCSDIVSGQNAAAEAALIWDASVALSATAREAYPAEFRYNAMVLAPEVTATASVSDFLYPDVAHERYPTIPLYLQQDYMTTKYGNFKITTNGCGITTFAMLASYFTDNQWTPPELCEIYGHYSLHNGTNVELFQLEPAALGFFLDYRTFNWPEALESIRDGYITVCLQYKGYWTRGGHFLALQGFNEDDLLVVRDSNIYNYGKLHGHQIDAFNPNLIPNAAGFYWIYQDKIVRIPACVRCGEAGSETAPEILFRQDYLCAKCLTATARRDSFLAG